MLWCFLPPSPDEPKAPFDDELVSVPPFAPTPAMLSSAGATTAGVAPGPTATPVPGVAAGGSAGWRPSVGSEDPGTDCPGAATTRPLPRLEGFRAGFALGLGFAFGPATPFGAGLADGRAAGEDERGELEAGVTKPEEDVPAGCDETGATVLGAAVLTVPVVVCVGALVVGVLDVVVVAEPVLVALAGACAAGAAPATAFAVPAFPVAAFPAPAGGLAAARRAAGA